MDAINVNNLVVKYKKLIAVDQVSFEVKEGEIFGIIGPNGAGKTSIIECIEGLRKQHQGEITILENANLAKNKIYQYLGVQLQEARWHDKLKVKDLIKLFSSFYPNPIDCSELLKTLGLDGHMKHYVRKLSLGQQQRLAIILALIGDPKIIILDEISSGLDPLGRIQIWELLKSLKKQNKTILMTTQYMEEAQYLCDRVCLIVKGKIRAIGTLDELIAKAAMPIKIVVKNQQQETSELKVNLAMEIYPELNIYALNNEIVDVSIIKPNLQDVFLKLTGEKIGELK